MQNFSYWTERQTPRQDVSERTAQVWDFNRELTRS